jgi:hypothetical protein
MNVVTRIILFLELSSSLISCNTMQSGALAVNQTETYLTINLERNIRSLIPASNGNRSEKFLYNQLYEPLLCKKDDGSIDYILIQNVSLDSSSNTYTFSLLKKSEIQ